MVSDPLVLSHPSDLEFYFMNQWHLHWKFSKIICPERFFMKMAFYRESCMIVVSIITELKPVFKDRRKHVIHCFTDEKNIVYHSLATKLWNIFFFFEKRAWMRVLRLKRHYSDGVFCSIVISWIALKFWAHLRLA